MKKRFLFAVLLLSLSIAAIAQIRLDYKRGMLIPNIRKTREIIGNKSNHITLIYSVL